MSKSRCMNERRRVQIHFPDDGLTKQSFVNESNINNLMAKYKTVDMRALAMFQDPNASFQDVSAVDDYQTACNIVLQANEMFAALPSALRNRFSNDPAEFLAFAHDESNLAEMRSLGLLKEEVSPPQIVPIEELNIKNPPME